MLESAVERNLACPKTGIAMLNSTSEGLEHLKLSSALLFIYLLALLRPTLKIIKTKRGT
jgi:hypothetical protein